MNDASISHLRKERDFLGEVDIPSDALFGIHSIRARENFPLEMPFHRSWFKAMGVVKKACYLTYKKMRGAVNEKYGAVPLPFAVIDDPIVDALIEAAAEISKGKHFSHFIVPAISGGAGTSINLNINEIVANRALQLLDEPLGTYDVIDPIEHANIFQSTNDVVPTALRVAAMDRLDVLEETINELRMAVEKQEAANRETLRVAYTQMQRAVPSSFGKLFAAYQEALNRDWWRISKCFERIKVVNLGGSAVGSGMTVPKYFLFEVVESLRQETGKPLTRGDHLEDVTSNLDPLVEVHGILKAHAVNLEKIAGDLRALASDAFGDDAVRIPARQVGSSIMPGKVNPVIAEYTVSAAHTVYANDSAITALAGQGFLDLNAYVPAIGHHLLQSLDLLISVNQTLATNLIDGLTIDAESTENALLRSPTTATALLPHLGYHRAEALAHRMQTHSEDIFAANTALKLIDESTLKKLMTPARLLELGYRIADVISEDDHAKKS